MLDLKKCNGSEIKTQIRYDAREISVFSSEQTRFSRREFLAFLENITLEFGINVGEAVMDIFCRKITKVNLKREKRYSENVIVLPRL